MRAFQDSGERHPVEPSVSRHNDGDAYRSTDTRAHPIVTQDTLRGDSAQHHDAIRRVGEEADDVARLSQAQLAGSYRAARGVYVEDAEHARASKLFGLAAGVMLAVLVGTPMLSGCSSVSGAAQATAEAASAQATASAEAEARATEATATAEARSARETQVAVGRATANAATTATAEVQATGTAVAIAAASATAEAMSQATATARQATAIVAQRTAEAQATEVARAEATQQARSEATAAVASTKTAASDFERWQSTDRAKVVYGPVNGSLSKSSGYPAKEAGVSLEQPILSAEFRNPASGPWSYGFVFRETGHNKHYRLMLNSTGRWRLVMCVGDLPNGNPDCVEVSTRSLAGMNTKAGGTNAVRLVVGPTMALLVVNDLDYATMNVSGKPGRGNVFIAAQFMVSDPKDTPIEFTNFRVMAVP